MALGTKAGSLLTPTEALKVAGTPQEVSSNVSKASVSTLMTYGSFSGADIKVVVHFPIDSKAKALLEQNKSQYEANLQKVNSQLNGIAEGTLIAAQPGIDRLQSEREGILSELQLIEDELDSLSKIPTSRVLGEIQTISWSIFREKSPVRSLGSVYPRAFTRGPRSISGSMIFTVFHEHALHEILSLNMKFYNTGTSDHDKYTYTTNLVDQLPPLDISLVFANEYGAISHMGIWGVEFFQEGGTFSIEDIFSENVIQYVARDLDPMTAIDKRLIDGQGVKEEWASTGSSLLREKQYNTNHLVRRNQFI